MSRRRARRPYDPDAGRTPPALLVRHFGQALANIGASAALAERGVRVSELTDWHYGGWLFVWPHHQHGHYWHVTVSSGNPVRGRVFVEAFYGTPERRWFWYFHNPVTAARHVAGLFGYVEPAPCGCGCTCQTTTPTTTDVAA